MKNDKSTNQGRRLILLKEYFLTYASKDHYVSMAEIKEYLAANEVGVEDRRTLYNAFEILREEFGIDVEYDRRKHGYRLTNPPFEPYELRLMVDSVQSANFITEKEAAAITEKIKKFADIHTRPSLNRKS